MSTVSITIEIDGDRLAGYTDERLALCWHVAQANPAPHGDYAAGDLTERIGREIIRRWLGSIMIVWGLVSFFWSNKRWWLVPMLNARLLLGALIVLAQSSAVAPFIYTLF